MVAQLKPTDDLTYVPRASIRVSADFNPRKVFSDKETAEFAERIRNSGWCSPLLVRPDPSGDGYLLVAGERRFRAISALGWEEVPVTIKHLDDVEHRRLALAENADRKELSVAEEAMAARDHVDAYGGDHEQAAASLGWPVARLRHRLRLLHATPEVMQALLEDRIQLGHAELLATLPAENQGKALPRILERGLSVTALREQLNGFATPLASAIFDKAGCAQCPFNSECQGTLFATVIDGGRCTNKSCFTDKTNEALAAKREALREDFGTVALLSEKMPGTTIPLVKFGDNGVGEQQFDACRGCQFRGAMLNDTPGAACGTVESPLCFNLGCHRTKVAEYRTLSAPSNGEVEDAPGAATTASPEAASTRSVVKGKPAQQAPAKPSKGKPEVRANLKGVVNQFAGIVRRGAVAQVQTDPNLPLALAVYGLLKAVSEETPRSSFSAVCKAMGVECREYDGSFKEQGTQVVLALAQMTADELHAVMQAGAIYMLNHLPDDAPFNHRLNRRALAANIVQKARCDLTPFVKVDAAYLGAFTREAMQAELEASGFRAWMESQDDGKKKYAALVNQKKDEVIKAVLASGFDFGGYLPAGLKPEYRDWRDFKKA